MDKSLSNTDKIVCPSCHSLNAVKEGYCDQCGAPLHGETTAMAQAFREAARARERTDALEQGRLIYNRTQEELAAQYSKTPVSREAVAVQEGANTMTQWPTVQTDRSGLEVPGTAGVLPLSNKEIIQRIERTAAVSDVERLLSPNHLTEVIVLEFVVSYLRPLAAATQETVTHRNDGAIVLPRRTIVENASCLDTISYGYHPAEVAFALKQFHSDVLTKSMQKVDHKKLCLSNDVLLGFSCVLGYYNLCCYLLQLPEGSDKNEVLWLQKFCDLSVSYSALESSMSGAVAWLQKNLPPAYASSPEIPCWFTFNASHYTGWEFSAAHSIISAEKNRLLAFRNSLYMYLAVVASHTD